MIKLFVKFAIFFYDFRIWSAWRLYHAIKKSCNNS